MKQFFLFSFALIAGLSQAQTTQQANADAVYQALQKRLAETIGKPFPEFKLITDSGALNNESFIGKTVFINFWFESCAPCIAEFEGLRIMYEKLKDNKDIIFIGVTYETQEKIKAVKEKFKLHYPMASIPITACYQLNMNNGFPTSIILDPTGKISYIHSGGSTNIDVATDFVMSVIYPRLKPGS